MAVFRALIADDEPPARRKLRRLLECESDFEVVGEAGTGEQAVEIVKRHEPDVAFLDVQMPGLDGFATLAALGDRTHLSVVFVTAFDHYAVRAFEVQAFDYLLKPVTEERLRVVLDRLRQAGTTPGTTTAVKYWKRILVPGPRQARFILVTSIDWIESDRNYVVLHCGPAEHLIRATLDSFLTRLDPDQFVRVNRSAAVNLERVRELRPSTHGEYKLVLLDGRELTWSRRYVPSGLNRFLAG
jgi:two-component system LytT family response regulator